MAEADEKGDDDEDETRHALLMRKSLADDNDLKRDDHRQNIARRLIEKNKERQLKQKTYRKEHELKLAFSEFYLSLILLQNYQTLNHTGFRKILKKHDKVT